MFKKVIFESIIQLFETLLSLLFIYFLGKYFYTLAEKHKQNRWLYAFLGVLIYYVSTFLFAFIIVGLELIFSFGYEDFLDKSIGYISIPFGILGCWGFCKLLEKKWEKIIQVEIESIDEIGKNHNLDD